MLAPGDAAFRGGFRHSRCRSGWFRGTCPAARTRRSPAAGGGGKGRGRLPCSRERGALAAPSAPQGSSGTQRFAAFSTGRAGSRLGCRTASRLRQRENAAALRSDSGSRGPAPAAPPLGGAAPSRTGVQRAPSGQELLTPSPLPAPATIARCCRGLAGGVTPQTGHRPAPSHGRQKRYRTPAEPPGWRARPGSGRDAARARTCPSFSPSRGLGRAARGGRAHCGHWVGSGPLSSRRRRRRPGGDTGTRPRGARTLPARPPARGGSDAPITAARSLRREQKGFSAPAPPTAPRPAALIGRRRRPPSVPPPRPASPRGGLGRGRVRLRRPLAAANQGGGDWRRRRPSARRARRGGAGRRGWMGSGAAR